MTRLNGQDLASALQSLPGWLGEDAEIRRSYQFTDFVTAIAFVNRVADLAEEANHHPDIDIRYNRVLIALSTHDEGGVTEKDVDLAARLDAAAGS
jgi:4a-hydroxytetrahydrobiopterin dehydratase